MILALGYTMTCQGQLKKMFAREANYGHFSGVVHVEQADSIVISESYGKRNQINQIDLQTRFDIGSITKQFTAAAILHLVKDGKLSLSDPINSLLGPYASDRWKKVNVHQLLTHTSGIPSIYQTEQGLDIFFPEKGKVRLGSLIGKFNEAKLLFSPGEEFGYSNSGYILLAAIIEEVSGQTYELFMLEMFQQYGLGNTSFDNVLNTAPPIYGYRRDLLKKGPVYDQSWFIGAGGIYSNVADLSKWVRLITSNVFLNDELRNQFLRSHTNAGYGYGWQFDGDRIQHDGGNAGFVSFLSFNPSSGATIIVLTNRSFEELHMYGKSADYIRELVNKTWLTLDGEEIEILPEFDRRSLIESEDYTLNELLISIEKMDTALLVTADKTYPSRLIYNTPLQGANEAEKKMIEIARLLKKSKYWSLSKYCDGEMKFVNYSGLMAIGMRMLKKKVGKTTEIIPYFVDEGNGVIRMKGDKGILDLIIYFDGEGKIQGIFEHEFHEVDKEVQMIAYPIGSNLYYLDGLPYGEKSATLKITHSELTIYQLNRSLVADRK